MSTYQLISYIKFLKTSSNEHGVHSPFVYDLCTKCFYNKSKLEDLKKIKEYIAFLRSKDEIIEIEDLGAGSRVFKDNKRVISKMARVAGSNYKEAKFLFKLLKYFKPKNVLELGTSLGISTYAMSLTGEETNISTVEGSKSLYEWNENNISDYFKNTNFINSSFDDYLENISSDTKFDLIYLDGNHNYDATISYFYKLKNHIHNDTILVLDDIYWSEEMTKAWEEIKQDDLVRVSIDTFSFGLIFFRKEQRKEHFTIRI